MSLLSRLLVGVAGPVKSRIRTRRTHHRSWRPTLESLENRTVLSTTSSISAGFNRFPIHHGDTIWFNSAFTPRGLGNEEATIWVTDQTISFSSRGVDYTVDVPDSVIHFVPGLRAADATTSFDASQNAWVTNLPLSFRRDAFLGGVGFDAGVRLPGGIHPVTWQASFSTDTEGVSLNWKWAAAVYSSFEEDPGVKPLDLRTSEYPNWDPAGTPEHFKHDRVLGARGGWLCNYTGLYTCSKRVTPDVGSPPPPPTDEGASLAGFVYYDLNQSGVFDAEDFVISDVTIQLYNENNVLVAETTTDVNGHYEFAGLDAGTYTILELQPVGFEQGTNNLGSLGGSADMDTFTVAVAVDDEGTDYNFGEILTTPDS